MAKRWYVVHVYSGFEKKIAQQLKDVRGVQVIDDTYNANPATLEAYLNAGGRTFASHFHYAWFSGPISPMQSYMAPMDWGNNLATWSAGGGQSNGPIPGTIETALMDKMMFAMIGKKVPMKRLGNVKEIAGLVEFILSDEAGYITGASLVVDGGVSL